MSEITEGLVQRLDLKIQANDLGLQRRKRCVARRDVRGWRSAVPGAQLQAARLYTTAYNCFKRRRMLRCLALGLQCILRRGVALGVVGTPLKITSKIASLITTC